MPAQGQTTPLNHESQKAPLREQQGKWRGHLHPINTSAAARGEAFPSECLDTCTHVLRVARSSSPEILHPLNPTPKRISEILAKG